MNSLYNKYPWLNITNSVEDYLEPEYYNSLLKEYVFKGRSDLQLFEDFLDENSLKKKARVLELGCGSGRSTSKFLSSYPGIQFDLDLVDLSKRMLIFCRKKFSDKHNIYFINSDSINFIYSSKEKYNLIFSLWSLSHSIHQNLIQKGIKEGGKYVKSVIRKMILENMIPSSKFFLIHFDSLSEEQKILMNQWKKVYSIYSDLNSQSPSKKLIDEIMQELVREGVIELEVDHLLGRKIVYSSSNEALEIFLNFHLESYFNRSPKLSSVISELLEYFKNFTDKDGKIKIQPRCFIYKVKKK